MIEVSTERFDELVDRALDSIPAELAERVQNVVVLVEDDPPPGHGNVLGLYEGVALPERPENFAGMLPDRIFLFRRPLMAFCDSEEQLTEEVRITVVHEVAHHFGIDDARLHELGYG